MPPVPPGIIPSTRRHLPFILPVSIIWVEWRGNEAPELTRSRLRQPILRVSIGRRLLNKRLPSFPS